MKVAIINKDENEDTKKLKQSFESSNISASFIRWAEVYLQTINGKTDIYPSMEKINGCFIGMEFPLVEFIEPLLEELVERNVYTQIKPESGFVCSNKGFMLTAIAESSIATPQFTILKGASLSEKDAPSEFPLIVRSCLDESGGLLTSSREALEAVVKGMGEKTIIIQEFIKGDLKKFLLVGNDVLGVRHKWNSKTMKHTEKGYFFNTNDEEKELARKVGEVVGADICEISTVNNKVVDISLNPHFFSYEQLSGRDVYKSIVELFIERMK